MKWNWDSSRMAARTRKAIFHNPQGGLLVKIFIFICVVRWSRVSNVVANTTQETTISAAESNYSTTEEPDECANTSVDTRYVLNRTQTPEQHVFEVTQLVCGVGGLCHSDVVISDTIAGFVCSSCQCDIHCPFYGDCCVDVISEESQPETSALHLTCTKADSKWTWDNHSSIFLVNRCPPDILRDESTKRKCEFPDITAKDQVLPVSSTADSRVTYRNVYCAQCHGVNTYRPWSHQVTCRTKASLSGARTKEELWSLVVQDKFCSIDSLPPSGVSVRTCSAVSIDSCNRTGRWPEYDEHVEQLCEMFTHQVAYLDDKGIFISYKNIFCALCNGGVIDPCRGKVIILSPDPPFPLSALLDFNQDYSTVQSAIDMRKVCAESTILDPFLGECVPLQCPIRRLISQGQCEPFFISMMSLGYSLSYIMRPIGEPAVIQVDKFKSVYLELLRSRLKRCDPYAIVILFVLLLNDDGPLVSHEVSLVHVFAQVATGSNRSLHYIEQTLREIQSLEWSFLDENMTTAFTSAPTPCHWPGDWRNEYNIVDIFADRDSLISLHPDCDPRKEMNCADGMEFPVVEEILDCPYVQFPLAEANFSYDHNSSILTVNNNTIHLNVSDILYCGDTLTICSNTIKYIRTVLSRTELKPLDKWTTNDLIMSWVSLVCIALSLVAQVLTFIVYCMLPQLRTMPGKNTMAFILHLFCAQLLFLVGNRRTEEIVLCQTLGVLIHHFWLTSFAWMTVCAYHMYKVFTNLAPSKRNPRDEWKTLLSYFVVCLSVASGVVLACISYHLIDSEGADIGYGGGICFLKGPLDIGVFFIAPLTAMLLFNTFCFIRTIWVIRKVPDMKEVSNKANRNYVFAYFRLSVLFGFTWVFGIMAAVFDSDVLWYVFIVLTGSQGLLIFIAYCANRRIWEMLIAMVRANRKSESRTSSRYVLNTSQPK